MCFISAGLFTHVKSWREERDGEGGKVVGQRVKKDEELRREREGEREQNRVAVETKE